MNGRIGIARIESGRRAPPRGADHARKYYWLVRFSACLALFATVTPALAQTWTLAECIWQAVSKKIKSIDSQPLWRRCKPLSVEWFLTHVASRKNDLDLLALICK
jgi:hypothetical protein